MTPCPDRRHRTISRALQLFLGLSMAAAAHAAPTVGPSALTGADGTWNRIPFIDQGTPLGYLVVSDAVHGRLLAFEGSKGTSWSLDLSATEATWSAIPALGSPPPPLNDPAAIYDPARNRVIVHGGANPTTNVTMGDVWALDLDGTPTWEQVTVSGLALRRQGHTATYDPIGDRMIVFGGLEHLTRRVRTHGRTRRTHSRSRAPRRGSRWPSRERRRQAAGITRRRTTPCAGDSWCSEARRTRRR
jgi:hypothetical protein